MLRTALFVVLGALAVAPAAVATAPPVGPLPKGPVTTIAAKKGSLVSVALSARAGLSWRLARNVDPHVLVEVSEANVGPAVVVVYRAVGRGDVDVKYGLTRGEEKKARASATFKVHVS